MGADATTEAPREGDWRRLARHLPPPADPDERADVLWQNVEAHLAWYDRQATRTRLAYTALKLVTLVAGAGVTGLAAFVPAAAIAVGGGIIVVSEGLQQTFQLHANWLSYRATAEALRLEGTMYVARVEPYADPATRRERLAAVVRDLTSKEGAAWAKAMKRAESPRPADQAP